tara:strand:+ start:14168 stop:14284 length:117 start_codon:yes stop_codon:yes gene_type:complete
MSPVAGLLPIWRVTDDGVLLVNLSDDTPVLLSTISEGQ